MIREVNEEELRRIGLMLWAITNSCAWSKNDESDLIPRALAAAIVAQISYCFITDDEWERRNRAKVVPSGWYYQLLQKEKINIVQVLQRSDIQNIEFFYRKNFVVIALQLGGITYIGIRGTQFAYDWMKNIKFFRKTDSYFGTKSKFHRGFYKESIELDQKINEFFNRTVDDHNSRAAPTVCLCGHSLGGAISALILQSQSRYSDTFCYAFGAPRITNLQGHNQIHQPTAFREARDIVPHCPPELAGYYSDFLDQRNLDGTSYSGSYGEDLSAFPNWIKKLFIYEGVKHHNIELYRVGIRNTLKSTHKNIDQYLTDIESRAI